MLHVLKDRSSLLRRYYYTLLACQEKSNESCSVSTRHIHHIWRVPPYYDSLFWVLNLFFGLKSFLDSWESFPPQE